MAKKALISTLEPIQSGYRVAEVVDSNNTFEVANGLQWIDCPDDLIADSKWYDMNNNTFNEFPEVQGVPTPTVEELQAQLADIAAQLQALQGAA